jgi:diketogulonate reductase-like aldo/keto reductase
MCRYVEDDLLDYCNANGILLQAASPLARSIDPLVKPGADPTVTKIAQKYNKSCAQVSLRCV